MKVAAATILSLVAVSAYASPAAYSASQEVSTDDSTIESSADVYLEKRGGGFYGYSQGAGRVHDPPFNDGHRRSHVTGGHQQHPQNHNPSRLYGPDPWRHPFYPRDFGPYEKLRHDQQQQRQQQQQYQQYLQYLQQQQYQRQYRGNRDPSGSYGNPRHTHQQYQVKQGTSNPSETSQHTQSAGSNVETKSEGGNNASEDETEVGDGVGSKSGDEHGTSEDGGNASKSDPETGDSVGSKSEVSKPEGEANTNLEFVFADLEDKVAKIQAKVAKFKAKVAESKDEGSSSEDETETGNDVGAKSGDEHNKSEDEGSASKSDPETGDSVGSKSEVSKPEGEANTNLEFVFADLEDKVAKIQAKVAKFKAKVAESKDEGSSSEVDPETGNDVGFKPEAQVVESGDNASEAPPSGLLQ
ncbi:hypothetical protein BASA60_003406 [Batrachochytrium salamandrivorans]|nr:hypothetical protein BASA60_003406 [Batrachochytrium salamandrivorans]